MSSFNLQRITAKLRLALLGDCGCARTLDVLAVEARAHGLTGAEIDTALAGRSFEARSDAAIAYACAIKSGNEAAMAAAMARAVRLGLAEADLAAVAETTRQIIADSGS